MSSRTTTPMICFVAAVLMLVTACSSSGSNGASSSTGAPTTTTPVMRAKTYSKPGPYAVGYTEMRLADGRRVVVWYPSTKQATEGHDREQIDIASLLSTELQAKIPAEDRVEYPADAFRDAKPRPQQGGYPVVVFSHGFAGFPEQSVTLTTHLASWGYVVAAPNHVERSLDGLLGSAGKDVKKSTDPQVLSATLDLVEAQSTKSGALLEGTVDADKVVVSGHSAGASAAYLAANADPRFKAWISYSVGFQGEGDKATPTPPDKPGMVMLGTKDGVDFTILTGYLRLGGELSVLGLVSISLEFVLSFGYEAGKAAGRATLTVKVEIAFFSKSVSISVEKKFAGSSGDPRFADVIESAPVWGDYASAFA